MPDRSAEQEKRVLAEKLVEFTNALFDEKSLLQNLHHHLSQGAARMSTLDILSTDIPLAERVMYIALDTWFLHDHFAMQLQRARDHLEEHIDALGEDRCAHSTRRVE